MYVFDLKVHPKYPLLIWFYSCHSLSHYCDWKLQSYRFGPLGLYSPLTRKTFCNIVFWEFLEILSR